MEVPSEDEVELVRDSRNSRDTRPSYVANPFWRVLTPVHPRRNPAPTTVMDHVSEQDEAVEVSSRRIASSQSTAQMLSSLDEDPLEEQLFNFGVPQVRYLPRRQLYRPQQRTMRPRTSDHRVPLYMPASSRAPRDTAVNAKAMKPKHKGLKELTSILISLSQQLHVLSQRRIAEKAAANASGDDGPVPETCPICFEAFHCPGTCTTRCGHIFHRKCLDACLENSRACPVCRANVHRAELIDLMSGFGDIKNAEEPVVDLINEPVEDREPLDESILKAVESVKSSIDKAQAVDKLDSDIRKKNEDLKDKVRTREKELELQQKNFERHMEDEKGRLEKRKQRMQKGEEVISEKDRELNQALIEARKHESAIQIRQGEVEASAAENERKRHELEVQISSLQDKTRRMNEIQNRMNTRVLTGRSNELKVRIAVLEQSLRRHRIPLPEDLETEKVTKEAPSRDAFMMELDGDVTVVETPVKRRKVTAPAKMISAPFGGELRKPSVYARPPPPRKGGVGIRSFAPERKTAARIGGVAQRGLNCFTKR